MNACVLLHGLRGESSQQAGLPDPWRTMQVGNPRASLVQQLRESC
jgi:hypothetical protein